MCGSPFSCAGSYICHVKKAYGGDYLLTLVHFFEHGVYEGRKASAYYDDKFYASTYPDLAGLTPYERFIHFLTQGSKAENRYASEPGKQETEKV